MIKFMSRAHVFKSSKEVGFCLKKPVNILLSVMLHFDAIGSKLNDICLISKVTVEKVGANDH